MITDLIAGGTYVPKWSGNRKLPVGDQIKVHWRRMSVEERDRLIRFLPLKAEVEGPEDVDSRIDMQGIFRTMTESIEGLSGRYGKEEPTVIATADALLASGSELFGLYDEVTAEYLTLSLRRDLKNSE